MISVIISSRNSKFFQSVSDNIAATIGVAFEIIKIDNAAGKLSICTAYNCGAAKAIYPYLCFAHEDVLFKTNGWGKNLINHFVEDDKIGLIGIAGSVYKTKMASGWGQTEKGWPEIKRMNIVQHYADNRRSKALCINPFNEKRSEVVAIDGVLMITKKELWLNNRFDEKLLTCFHAYDIDFSLQLFKNEKVVVVYDVLIEHFSGGNFNATWLFDCIKVHQKWKAALPAARIPFTTTTSVYEDGWKRLKKQLVLLQKNKVSVFKILTAYHQLFLLLDNKPSFLRLCKDYCKGMATVLTAVKIKSQPAIANNSLPANVIGKSI